MPEPLPLDKEQIPLSPKDTPLPLRDNQIPGGASTATPKEEQESLTKQGQRKVNLLWEATQTGLAFLTLLFVGIILTLQYARGDPDPQAPEILEAVLLVIVTMYYQRTNHTKIGGVGYKEGER